LPDITTIQEGHEIQFMINTRMAGIATIRGFDTNNDRIYHGDGDKYGGYAFSSMSFDNLQTALFTATYIGLRNFEANPSAAFRTCLISGDIVPDKFSTKTITFKLEEPVTDIVLLNPSTTGMEIKLDTGAWSRFLKGRTIILKNISAYAVTLRLDPDSISTTVRLDGDVTSKSIAAGTSISLVYYVGGGGYFDYYTV